MDKKTLARIKEFGDFQTPIELTDKIFCLLKEQGILPSTIIEPTCGYGSFIISAVKYFPKAYILGFDINPEYVESIRSKLGQMNALKNVEVIVSDFFKTNWQELIERRQEPVLIVGNPPWITSAEISVLGGNNIPKKSNIHGLSGIEAITGKSNFDVSEWMSIQLLKALNGKKGTYAMICKASVARKLFAYINKEELSIKSSSMYLIDSKKHFNISADACVFICNFNPNTNNYTCHVFKNMDRKSFINEIGYIDKELIANISLYHKWKHLKGKCDYTWRSGIKHDCAKVMVLEKRGNEYFNGFNEPVRIEDEYLFPLLKSSDLANNRVDSTNKFLIVPQTFVGEDTSKIKSKAPLTWDYLTKYSDIFDKRKSRIYQNKPKYSIFGVGEYSFSPWKIAISGFYKKLNFRLIKPLYTKPVVFDDTCYFIPANSWEDAIVLYNLYNHEITSEFFRMYIFWDSKRPITKEILKKLSLKKLVEEIGIESLVLRIGDQERDLDLIKVKNKLKKLLN
ncbi:MAG: N-6 DNA methylase [Candidatus Hodarchaeales archaeon]